MQLTKYPLEPFSQRLKCFCVSGLIVGIAFFTLYPLLNWLTSLRTHTLGLYWERELTIPFIPPFIWLYLSMYVIFLAPLLLLNSSAMKKITGELVIATLIAAIVFLIIPCHLGFTRLIPTEPFYAKMFTMIFQLDYPHNLVPSLHVVYSTSIVLAVTASAKKWLIKLAYGWLFLLMCSTLLMHQHHLIDVITGFGLAWLTHTCSGRYYEKNYHTTTHTNKFQCASRRTR